MVIIVAITKLVLGFTSRTISKCRRLKHNKVVSTKIEDKFRTFDPPLL